MQISLRLCDQMRGAPTMPDAFEKAVCSKHFTSGSHLDEIVLPRYQETFTGVIEKTRSLSLAGLGLDDKAASDVMVLMRRFPNIRELDLGFNRAISVPLREWAVLAKEVSLTKLNLMETEVSMVKCHAHLRVVPAQVPCCCKQ